MPKWTISDMNSELGDAFVQKMDYQRSVYFLARVARFSFFIGTPIHSLLSFIHFVHCLPGALLRSSGIFPSRIIPGNAYWFSRCPVKISCRRKQSYVSRWILFQNQDTIGPLPTYDPRLKYLDGVYCLIFQEEVSAS